MSLDPRTSSCDERHPSNQTQLVSQEKPRPLGRNQRNQNTPPRRQLRNRTFSVKLARLRERSNETSTSEGPLQALPASFCNWNGTLKEYIAANDGAVVAKKTGTDPQIAELQERCAERLGENGGDLKLTIFKSIDKNTSKTNSRGHMRQVSSSSSTYDGGGSMSPPLAPGAMSPPHHGTMNLRDLEKYSRANDRLSNLRSDSDSVGSGGEDVRGAAEDAADVAQGWEAILSNRLKKSPFLDDKNYRSRIFTHDWREDMIFDRPQSTEFGRQYDGAHSPQKHTAQHSTDATSVTEISVPINKRKASVFSLRSIQSSLAAKRQKLSFSKLATNISSTLSSAKRRLKEHNIANRRNFEA